MRNVTEVFCPRRGGGGRERGGSYLVLHIVKQLTNVLFTVGVKSSEFSLTPMHVLVCVAHEESSVSISMVLNHGLYWTF